MSALPFQTTQHLRDSTFDFKHDRVLVLYECPTHENQHHIAIDLVTGERNSNNLGAIQCKSYFGKYAKPQTPRKRPQAQNCP